MQISKKVEFKIQPEAAAAVQQLIATFLQAIEKEEKGQTLLYKSFVFEAESNRFMHVMIFKDEEAEQQHKEARHTQAFVKGLYPLCIEGPVFMNLMEINSLELG